MTYFINHETALIAAANSVERYVLFLDEIVQNGNRILQGLAQNGLETKTIAEELQNITNSINAQKEALCALGQKLGQQIQESVTQVEQADNFSFPHNSAAAVPAFAAPSAPALAAPAGAAARPGYASINTKGGKG